MHSSWGTECRCSTLPKSANVILWRLAAGLGYKRRPTAVDRLLSLSYFLSSDLYSTLHLLIYSPHNHRLISVCVCLQIGIVKRLYLEYPRHKQAGYTVEFTGRDRHGNEFTRPDRQEYVHANLRPAPQQSEQNEERHTPVETPLSSAAETVGETS